MIIVMQAHAPQADLDRVVARVESMKLRPHVIVGTPGRVLQLVKRGDLNLSNLKIFVLDECDKMLEEYGKSSENYSLNCRHV